MHGEACRPVSTVEVFRTQTAVLTTEHASPLPRTPQDAVLLVDAAALVAGETLTLRFKATVLAAGTERLIREAVYAGPLGEPHIQSPPVVMPQGGTITLTQTGGTGRAFPWSIVILD